MTELEYWWSEIADCWLVADVKTGNLVAKVPLKAVLLSIFEADVIRPRSE